MKIKLLTYAILNDTLVHIDSVENGIKCNCVCPNRNCNGKLIAKNNEANIMTHHFQHYNLEDCEGAYESALHMLAKKIISEKKEIYFPNYIGHKGVSFLNDIFKKGELVRFDRVILEEYYKIEDETVKIDVVGYLKDKKYFIEFAKTHFVDKGKKIKLEKLGIPCIEINISNQELDEEKLAKTLLSEESVNLSKWIICKELDIEYEAFLDDRFKINHDNKKKLDEKSRVTKNIYENNENFGKFELDSGNAYKCPKLKIHLLSKLEKRYLDNRVIQSILNGAKWNGEFERRASKGLFIKVDDKVVWVYLSDEKMASISKEEKTSRRILYGGLKAIIKERNHPFEGELNKCSSCFFMVDSYSDNGKEYSVCKFKAAPL